MRATGEVRFETDPVMLGERALDVVAHQLDSLTAHQIASASQAHDH
jgi:hypothetical protein